MLKYPDGTILTCLTKHKGYHDFSFVTGKKYVVYDDGTGSYRIKGASPKDGWMPSFVEDKKCFVLSYPDKIKNWKSFLKGD